MLMHAKLDTVVANLSVCLSVCHTLVLYCRPTIRLPSFAQTSVVTAESFSDRPGPL